MNLEILRQKLLAAARTDTPSDAVPYAFEKRVMARLGRREAPDAWTAWGALLWQAVAPCCGLMVLVGIGSLTLTDVPEDLGVQLETLLLADLDAGRDLP